MWIAKPVHSLSETERIQWQEATGALEEKGTEVPLAQTLAWADAIRAVSGQAWLAFSPDEKVGGLVFAAGGRFECVNGPLLHWEDAKAAPRQLATFAMAVAKLAPGASGVHGLSARPRWSPRETEGWLRRLPIEAYSRDRAATIQVPIEENLDRQFARLRPRLQRTLARALKLQEETEWRPATAEALATFVPALAEFGRARGFTVPPLDWFQALARSDRAAQIKGVAASDGLTLWLVSSRVGAAGGPGWAQSEILVAFYQRRAHYLFGYERRSEGSGSGALSAAALSHWLALVRCLEGGIKSYDLNGYVLSAPEDHPYAGVCRFKEQFGGEVVEYETPEFRIDF